MSDQTKIEWADATLNYINGCSVISPGCTNCYAMRLAGTRLRNHPTRAGLTQDSKAGPVWTGEVRAHEPALMQALKWRRPRRIFWNAHGDTFHDAVPDAWIDRLFAICALTPQHTHMILTKRSARMQEYCSDPATPGRLARVILDWLVAGVVGFKEPWPVQSVGEVDAPDDVRIAWPLPNVWLGVSVEDQQRADERVPDLLATPAAVRFISAEPLLGPVDMTSVPWPDHWPRCECRQSAPRYDATAATVYCPGCCEGPEAMDAPVIDWVIAGGESGPGARPMHPDWARSLRDQCQAAGVPFLFKQWGEWEAALDRERDDPDWRADYSREFADLGKTRWLNLEGGCGFHGARFHVMRRVGKKAAGRLLDGVEWSEFPA